MPRFDTRILGLSLRLFLDATFTESCGIQNGGPHRVCAELPSFVVRWISIERYFLVLKLPIFYVFVRVHEETRRNVLLSLIIVDYFRVGPIIFPPLYINLEEIPRKIWFSCDCFFLLDLVL
jgi:hypothetical protein